MKLIARIFALTLVLTGAIASTQIANASNTSKPVAVAKTSAYPVPMCDPSDPNGCGI